MKTNRVTFSVAVIAAVLVVALVHGQAPQVRQDPVRLLATIALPQVRGRIDHLAFDALRRRLFVAALGNDTVEVIDASNNAVIRSLPRFHEPQGIAVVTDLGAVAVANGDTGTLQLIDDSTLQTRWTMQIGGDADNVRYDVGAKRVLVAYQGGIAIVDPAAARVVQRIAISGHPESFQLESQGSRVFANLPGAPSVVVVDRSSASVRTRWPTGSCGANYPMALDDASHRLFIGCRRPASLALLDTSSGKMLASIPAVADADDLFYDPMRQRLYMIGGEGFLDVVQRDGDAMRRVAHVATREGARTGVWAEQQSRLYIAVPASRGRSAEIRVFAAP